MLIHQHAFTGGNRHVRAGHFHFQRLELGASLQGAAQGRGLVFVQQADSIGTTPLAVGHLLDVFARFLAQGNNGLPAGFGDPRERGILRRLEWNHVLDVSPEFCGNLGNFNNVLIVDARNDDGVHLDHNAPLLEALDGCQLPVQQDFGPLLAAIDDIAILDPGVDFRANGRVHRRNGDGHMGHAQLGYIIQIRQDSHAIGRQAEQELRMLLIEQTHGLNGLGRVGKWIARTGNACHGDTRFLFQHLIHILRSLIRLENAAGHTGAGLVHTVILAIAVVALNVAFGGHGQMYTAAGASFFLIETRVLGGILVHDSLLWLPPVTLSLEAVEGVLRQALLRNTIYYFKVS